MSSQESICSLLPLHYDGHQIRTSSMIRQNLVGCPGYWNNLGIVNVRQNLAEFPDDEKGVSTIYTREARRIT